VDYLKILSDVKESIKDVKAAAEDGKLTVAELAEIGEDFLAIMGDLVGVLKTIVAKQQSKPSA
jgi:hypothetical protein